MAQTLVVDQAAHEDPAGAVGPGELHFGHGAGDLYHGDHRDPAQPPFALGADIDEPAVVAPADGIFDFDVGRQRPQK